MNPERQFLTPAASRIYRNAKKLSWQITCPRLEMPFCKFRLFLIPIYFPLDIRWGEKRTRVRDSITDT